MEKGFVEIIENIEIKESIEKMLERGNIKIPARKNQEPALKLKIESTWKKKIKFGTKYITITVKGLSSPVPVKDWEYRWDYKARRNVIIIHF